MSHLFDPITIGNLTLKNRIVFAPASFGHDALSQYEKLAHGGCGMIVLADLSVVPSFMGAPGLDSMQHADYFRQIIDVCHRYDCKVSAQLFHPEYDVLQIRELYQLMGRTEPQKVRTELSHSIETFCDTLTPDHIAEILIAFEIAANRAETIGFDMIQIHGDRLAGSFTSPHFNHRTDAYGDYRKFPVKLVSAIRKGALHLPLDYKLTIRTENPDYGRGGIAADQISEFVRLLENAGIDSFHVSLANHTTTGDTIPAADHPYFSQPACFSALALNVAQHTSKPVCCVGKIQNPETAEDLLTQGISLIGMCRQLIADPEWPEKILNHNNNILKCTYCNQSCVGALKTGRTVGCILHKRFPHLMMLILTVLALGSLTACSTATSAGTAANESASQAASPQPDAVSSASQVFYQDASISGIELLEAIRQADGACTIATVNADGTPNLIVSVPGVVDDTHLVFGWADNATKANLLRDKQAVIAYYIYQKDGEQKEDRHRGARLICELEEDNAVIKRLQERSGAAHGTFLKIAETLPIG